MAMGCIMPAPIPCVTRNNTSTGSEWESPQQREEMTKMNWAAI